MFSPTAEPGEQRYAEDRMRRLVKTLPVIRLLALLAFITALVLSFSLTAHALPTLIAPDSAVKGQEVEARIENAPQNEQVRWTWDRGRLHLLESGDSAARFEAILDGKAWIEVRIGNWRQRVSVVITRTDVITPTTPIEGPKEDPKIAKSKQLLEQFRSGQINATQFFQNMGNEGISVKDIVAYKAHVIEQERLRLIKEDGLPASEAIPRSQEHWQREFAPYEQQLMYSRQQGVNRAWDQALARYIELHPDLPYVGAKMDVGGWATVTKAATPARLSPPNAVLPRATIRPCLITGCASRHSGTVSMCARNMRRGAGNVPGKRITRLPL